MSPRELDLAAVQRRVETMLPLLDDLRSVGEVTAPRLEAQRLVRHGIERILTQLVELAVATNSHVASALSGTAPQDYRSSFSAAARAGVITEDLAARLAPAVGLRNILVHDYAAIDLAIVARSVGAALVDFSDYCAQVGAWLAGPGSATGASS